MKIIGNAQQGELLISASREELARLIGFYYGGAKGCPELKPGLEFKVAAMFEQLNKIASNHDRLSRIAAELRAYADRLEVFEPVVLEVVDLEVDGG